MTDLFSRLTDGHTTTSHEGGAVFNVSDRVALRRFLVAGSFGSFYVDAKTDVAQWKDRVEKIVKADPEMAMGELMDVASNNLALKRDPSLFLLARLMMPDMPLRVRSEASAQLPRIAVTGTDLLHFMAYRYGAHRTSNKLFRTAVKDWFDTRDVGTLALQAVKYDQRDGWSMRDVLRLARPVAYKQSHPMRDAIYKWMAHPEARLTLPYADLGEAVLTEKGAVDAARLMVGYSEARMGHTSPEDVARIILQRRLPREAVPSQYLNDPAVWAALKVDMPAQALLRNLGKLSSLGLIGADDVYRVQRTGSHLHPFAILLAKAVYDSGQGFRGKLSWKPRADISNALEEAFHLAFGALKVRHGFVPLIALDVSGSMRGSGNTPLSPMLAEAALAMILAKQYPEAVFYTFSAPREQSGAGFFGAMISHGIQPISIHGLNYRQVLQNMSVAEGIFGWTDINLPFEEARSRPGIDAVIVLTDNETRNKQHVPPIIHDIQRTRPDFRSAVVALEPNGISVLNPNDPKQADFAGMDASLPKLLTMFLDGDLG